MKKILLLFIALSVAGFFSASAQGNTAFKINVEVKNLKAPAKLILTVREISEWVEYKVESSNGKFVLSGQVKEPSFAYLVMKYGNETNLAPRLGNIRELFVEPGNMIVTTDDSLRIANVKGSRSQNELDEWRASAANWSKTKDSDRLASVTKFIAAHPQSFVSLYLIQNFSMDGSFTIDADRATPLVAQLSPAMKNTLSGKTVLHDMQVARQTAIGALAPDFVQRDTTEKEIHLSSLRGRFVLIDFWASWCGPCRAENPALVKVFNEFNKKNFTILSVSLDQAKKNWTRAIRKDGLTWTHVSDLKFWKNEVALLYGVKTVPQNFLLDPEGKIIARNLRPEQLSTKLKSLLP